MQKSSIQAGGVTANPHVPDGAGPLWVPGRPLAGPPPPRGHDAGQRRGRLRLPHGQPHVTARESGAGGGPPSQHRG